MVLTRPSWRNTIATIFVAALFVLIGAGHDVLLAAHAIDAHAQVACHDSHQHDEEHHDEHGDESSTPDNSDDDCDVCHLLLHAQSVKGYAGVPTTTLILDEGIELAVVTVLHVDSVDVRESRARDPPAAWL